MKRYSNVLLAAAIVMVLLTGCGKSESIPTGGDVNKTEDASKNEDVSKGEDISKNDDANKTESVNEAEDKEKTEDTDYETEILNNSEQQTVTERPAQANQQGQTDMENITAGELVKEMKIGWNLGNTMDSLNSNLGRTMPAEYWETAWGNPVTSQGLIDAVIAKGFNVIRIPVSWNDHISDTEWSIEESWMNRVQEIVDYAYNKGVYVIINTHHESWYEPYYDNEEHAAEMLTAVWSQIAERFQDYDEHLIFEGMNEPRKIGTGVEWTGGDQEGWDVVNSLNQVFIKTVRESGGNNPFRILMIPGYAANCWEGIKHIEVPQDDKIIVSVHAYEPYEFALNVQGRGTWDNDMANIDTVMNSLDTLFLSRGIPVIIGEFGAMYKNVEGNEEERAAWAEYYVRAAAQKGIPCIWWDNGAFTGSGELFGIIDRKTYEWKYPLITEGLMKGIS